MRDLYFGPTDTTDELVFWRHDQLPLLQGSPPGLVGDTLGGRNIRLGGFLNADWSEFSGSEPEGIVVLTYTTDADGEPRTVLSFWNRALYMRAGMHSTFILDGMMTYEHALQRAYTLFDWVFDMFGYLEIEPHPGNPDYEDVHE